MHAFSPGTSGGKRFTELVVSSFLVLEQGQKQRSLLSPSTTGERRARLVSRRLGSCC